MVRLLQPQLLLFILTALALMNLWRKRQESRRRLLLITVPFVCLVIISTPVFSFLALGSLEWSYPPLDTRPDDVQAIVVLAGNIREPDSTTEPFALGVSTLNRCIKAAKLYRQGKPCPIVVSGGKIDDDPGAPAVADVMKDFLIQLGVKPADLIVEGGSQNTHENALEVKKLLAARNVDRIVLVTDAAHLARALDSFGRQGLATIVPCGCRYRSIPPSSVFDFLPDANAPRNVLDAWHEWLGIIWYRLRGH